MKIKLTEKSVKKMPAPDPSGRQKLYWDAELKGFGVLCSGVTNSKTFVAQRDLGGRSRRITVASAAECGVERARELAADVLLDMRRGVDPRRRGQGVPTLREALDRYLDSRKGLRERSAKAYRDSARLHLKPLLGRPLTEITRDDVERRHKAIAEDVERRTGKSGGATANMAMRTLRAVWRDAEARSADVPPCPVKLGGQWFKVSRRERLVKGDDMPKFYEAVRALENPVARDYLLFVLFTGTRRSEAAALRWEDVDLEARLVRLPASSTKAGRLLQLPLSDFVHDLLVARRALGDGKWVFPANSKSGHVEEPKGYTEQVKDRCGVGVSVHDLRRTYITAAEQCDISYLALKALVNHSTGADVTAGYAQMTVERLREPAQRVCDRLRQQCRVPDPGGENVTKLRSK